MKSISFAFQGFQALEQNP